MMRFEVRNVPSSVERKASPFVIGFWIYVNNVMLPITGVQRMVAEGYAELVFDVYTNRNYIQGTTENLKLWLPDEVFKNGRAHED